MKEHRLLRSNCHWVHGYKGSAVCFGLERHNAVSFCEQSMICTHAYICTRMPLGTALANNDIACDNSFATEFFNAKAFRL